MGFYILRSISTCEIKEHLRFLRAVHVASSRGKGSLLYADGPSLRAAVRAYFAWLMKAAESGPWSCAGETAGQALVTRAPPLGIAWCWHVHRLSPLQYTRHCVALTGGTVVYPAPGYGFAFAHPMPGFDVTDEADVANATAWVTMPGSISFLPDGPVHTAAEEDALVASIGRHAPFLFQVSGAAYNDEAFLTNAISRYEKFVALYSTTEGALAPPVDVDLVWHTHMLRGADYETESGAMRGGASSGGGPLDHDNGEGVHATLDAAWARTLDAWNGAGEEEREGLALAAVPSGAERRGEPPPWWNGGEMAAGGVLVLDGFLSAGEMAAIVRQMPKPSEAVVGGGGAAGGRGHGKDARTIVQVDASLEGRIKVAVSRGLGLTLAHDAISTARASKATENAPPVPKPTAALPARVAVGKMGLHRDRLAVKQAAGGEAMLADFADGYIAVVYLSTGGTLVLEPDAVPGEGDAAWVPSTAALSRRDIAVQAGRLVAWPNYAYKHGAGLAADGGADGGAARWILGPVALLPGRARLAQSGDCSSATRWKDYDKTSNALHRMCGGWRLLLIGGEKEFGPPTKGSCRIEDFERLGPEARLKELAAEKTFACHGSATHLPLHMLCANPNVSVDIVKFVGKLYPAAAAIPTSKSRGAFNRSHHFHDVLPLHLLCLNKSVTPELFHAVAALYPAALDAECTEDAGNQVKGLFGDPGPRARAGWRFKSEPLKPLDILKVFKPSIGDQCSRMVYEIRKLPSPPEATAMAEELARSKMHKAELERLGKLEPKELATHNSMLAAMLQHSDEDVRMMALQTVGKLGQEDLTMHATTLAALATKFEVTDKGVWMTAVRTFGELAPGDKWPLQPNLAQYAAAVAANLNHPDEDMRMAAAEFLGNLAVEDLVTHSVGLVARLEASDETYHVRKAVEQSLGKLPPKMLARHDAALAARLKVYTEKVEAVCKAAANGPKITCGAGHMLKYDGNSKFWGCGNYPCDVEGGGSKNRCVAQYRWCCPECDYDICGSCFDRAVRLEERSMSLKVLWQRRALQVLACFRLSRVALEERSMSLKVPWQRSGKALPPAEAMGKAAAEALDKLKAAAEAL